MLFATIFYISFLISYRACNSFMFNLSKPKKPGPRPSICIWCNEAKCTHCQCTGHPKCDHAPGQACSRPRYNRRLVCNPCEKSKLKDDGGKKALLRNSSKDRVSIKKRMSENGHIGIARSAESGLNRATPAAPTVRKIYSFEALLQVVQKDYNSGEYAVTPHYDDVGLSMDGSRETNAVAEEVNTTINSHPPLYPTPTRQLPHLQPFLPKPHDSISIQSNAVGSNQPPSVFPMYGYQDCIFPFRGM